jgi:hypothetical protein
MSPLVVAARLGRLDGFEVNTVAVMLACTILFWCAS